MINRIRTALCLIAFACAATSAAVAQSGIKIEAIETAFRITLADGTIKQGTELAGAILVFNIADRPVRIRIASVNPDPNDPSVLLHDFRIADTGASLCAPDPDGKQVGFPLSGRSTTGGGFVAARPDVFELVCTSGAQGKCIRLGYRPWSAAPSAPPSLDYFNACVRMARADYCGDGRSWTRDGTLIDVWDVLNIQKPEKQQDPAFSFEAAWTPDGAVCVAHTRVPENITTEKLMEICPRLSAIRPCTVSAGRAGGALMFNASR